MTAEGFSSAATKKGEMDTKKTAVVVAVVAAVVAAVGYAYVAGIGPLEQDPAAGLDEPPDTDESYEIGDDTEGDAQDGGPPFAFEVESVNECGETCREVNVALHRTADEDAQGTVVHTWIYAGETTDRDAVVWADNRQVGEIEAGGVVRSTDEVDLSVQQANNVREADGVVTIETTVESGQETVRFVDREDVM